MRSGDVQIYDKPARSSWKSPLLWVFVIMLLVGIGAYVIPSLG